MISLFQIAPNDQSVAYLGQIFGVVSAGVLSPQSAPMLLGVLFKVFNTSVLTLGAGIVIYTTIVGLMKTAQEGEFLGKQWSSLWVPLRTVFGIAALFPLPTGYSAIQVIFMWIILQGVGAADTLWKQVINYTVLAGSPTASQDFFSDIGLETNLTKLYQGLVCQAEAARTASDMVFSGNVTGTANFYCHANPTDEFCKNTVTTANNAVIAQVPTALSEAPAFNIFAMGPGGKCGTLKYWSERNRCTFSKDRLPTQTNILECQVTRAQKAALNQIIPLFAGIAENFAQADDESLTEVQARQATSLPAGYTSPEWLTNYCLSINDSSGNGSCINATDTILGSDNYNANSDFVQKAYWPFVIKPLLGNTANSAEGIPNFITAAEGLYTASIKQAIVLNHQISDDTEGWNTNDTFLKQLQAQVNSDKDLKALANTTVQAGPKAAIDQGWIYAGGYFYNIIKQTGKEIAGSTPKIDVVLGTEIGDTYRYRNNVTAAGKLVDIMTTDSNPSSTSGTSSSGGQQSAGSLPGPLSPLDAVLQGIGGSIIKGFLNCLTGSGNPLINVSTFGQWMMSIAEVAFSVLTISVFFIGLAAGLNAIVLGNGMTVNPVGEGIKAISNMLTPFFIALIVGLFSMGVLFAVYVPLIPFMIFSMGAIGWMLATVEAMVAAPIVALGILSPGGQSEMLGRAEPALMLLLNLFLRPGLMVVGLMASTLVSVPVMALINTTFFSAVSTLFGITINGLFMPLLVIAMYASFVITVFGKCYSLIYVIPERVLTWIGGQAVQYGEAEALQASKQAVEGAASAIGGAAREAPGGAMGYGSSKGEGQRRKEKDDDDKKNEATRKTQNDSKGGG